MTYLNGFVSRYFPRGAKPSNGGYLVSCPCQGHAHGDMHPSLSVHESSTTPGLISVHCFAFPNEHDGQAVCDALGIPISELYAPEIRHTGNSSAVSKSKKPRASAVTGKKDKLTTQQDIPFEYRDSSFVTDWTRRDVPPPSKGEAPIALYLYLGTMAKPIYLKARYAEPSRNSSEKAGKRILPWTYVEGRGWYCGRGDFPRMLYKPGGLNTEGKVLLLCEGEKCVDAVCNALGLCAACGDDASHWHEEFTQEIVSAGIYECWIWPDHDSPGEKYARTAAESLSCAGLACRVLDPLRIWDAMPPKGDVVDALNALGAEETANRLNLAAAETDLYEPTAEPEAELIMDGCLDIDIVPSPFEPYELDAGWDFARLFMEKLHFVDALGWLCYESGDHGSAVWKCDNHAALIRAQVYAYKLLANTPENDKDMFAFARRCRTRRGLDAILAIAKPHLHIAAELLDANANTLNTGQGILSLTDGTCRPASPEDRCMAQTAEGVGEDLNAWTDFVLTTFGGDLDLVEYVQIALGASLYGTVYEERLYIAYGGGSNGKSTFFGIIQDILGDYSCSVSKQVLLKPGRFDKAQLRGKRLVITGEIERGESLSVSALKELCSTDKISVERKYHDAETVSPTHSIWMFTNNLPRVDANDFGTWRRLCVIPFINTIPVDRADRNLRKRLVEQSGLAILRWLVTGAVKYAANGYQLPEEPEAVKLATGQYRQDSDAIDVFFRDIGLEKDADGRIPTAEVYKMYRDWCERSGEFALCKRDFSVELGAHGIVYRKHASQKLWLLRCVPSEQTAKH